MPVGGSLSGDIVTDEELFIRWLQIVAFLPVISFHTPPWVSGDERVYQPVRLTLLTIPVTWLKHQAPS